MRQFCSSSLPTRKQRKAWDSCETLLQPQSGIKHAQAGCGLQLCMHTLNSGT